MPARCSGLAGVSGRTLAFGPGHVDGTPLPGDPGNSVLSGHRDTHFAFLRELRSGDILLVSTGRDARRAESGGQLNPFTKGLPGLHPDCLRWLSQREVAVLCGDGISDLLPPRPSRLCWLSAAAGIG